MKSLLIVYSYHHHNTEKIANSIAGVLGAQVKTPQQILPEEVREYDLVGFGSGIYGEKHHTSLLKLVDVLLDVDGKKAFLFSMAAFTGEAKVAKDHRLLREKLQSKGYVITGEFGCKGFNTNSFLKYIGGMNRGKPDAEDLKLAEEFARSLKKSDI